VSSGRGRPWDRAQSIAEALRRAGTAGPPRPRTVQVRVYDHRGLARAVPPDSAQGRSMRVAAEAMLRDVGL
jgi:hypothetical protein